MKSEVYLKNISLNVCGSFIKISMEAAFFSASLIPILASSISFRLSSEMDRRQHDLSCDACAHPESGGWGLGVWTPYSLKNHKNLVLFINTVLDSVKNHKDTKPEFNVGPSSTRK